MKLAGYGARITAAIIDLVVVSVGTTVLAWPFLSVLKFDDRMTQITKISQEFAKNPDSVQIEPEFLQSMFIFMMWLLVLMLILLLVMHTYYIYLESSASGQTLGKKALGLRVVDLEGQRITRTQAVYREALRWYVDGLFIFPAFIAMFSTTLRQRVGDIAAKTVVIDVSQAVSQPVAKPASRP